MRRLLLGLLFGLAGAQSATAPAAAHEADILTYRPYVIVKTCHYEDRHCRANMKYAPGQHAGLAGSGSYFYRKARKGKHGDFVLTSGAHHHHAHGYKAKPHWSRRAREAHRRDWCRNHVWGFDTLSGTFAGGVPHRVRCVPSYDRR